MTAIQKVERQAAQGDVLFQRVGSIPREAEQKQLGGRIVVAHSETGHHHTVESPGAAYFTVPNDPMTCFLRLEQDCEVTHHRPFDTHQTFALGAGDWLVRRQREYTPQGWRRVED